MFATRTVLWASIHLTYQMFCASQCIVHPLVTTLIRYCSHPNMSTYGLSNDEFFGPNYSGEPLRTLSL